MISPIRNGESKAPDGQLPILIGVTGHRDLRREDLSMLRSVVNEILEGMERRFPHTPLTLLTALAEGSDRLVAEQALERGWSIIAALPMRREIYEAQFESTASREEFSNLLERADLSFELPDLRRGDTQSSSPDRDWHRRQYEALGVFLVRHAQILIALWDGYRSEDVGGTSHVVQINLQGNLPTSSRAAGEAAFLDLDPWDRGPLHHVMTPRASGASPNGVPFEMTTLYPYSLEGDREARTRFDTILTRIDLFNRELRDGGKALATEAAKASRKLIPLEVEEGFGRCQHELLRRFGFADALAARMQSHHRRSLATLLGLVLLALASFEAYDNLMPEVGDASPLSLLVLAAYPVALSIAYLVYAIFRKSQFQNRHLDYRALAEGLRVQLFWNMSGLGKEVSDHYLRKQSSELRWVHEAIRVSNVYAADSLTSFDLKPGSRTPVQYALEHWVQSQLRYYVAAATRDAKNVLRGSRLATSFYASSIATTLLVLIVDGVSRLRLSVDFLAELRPILFMSIAMMLGLSALIRAYSEKMGFSEQALQYQRMRGLFTRAEQALQDGLDRKDDAAIKKVLLDLGEEALQENADWVLFRRSRGIEIPQG